MKKITIQYGGDILHKTVPADMTVGQLKDNDEIRTGLGFGDNINVLIAGVAQPDEAVIPGDTIVKIETAANKKAV